MPASRVRIEDVARAARCSKSAASYALRDHPKISAARRRLIKKVARELGYMPDPQISKLMVHLRSSRAQRFVGKLAFINTHESDRDYAQRTPALHSIFTSAVERARDLGYEFEDFWLHEPGLTPARLADILEARGIRGVMLGSTGKPAGPVPFAWRRFAAVTAGYTVEHPGIHRVVSHYYRNTRLALRQLAAFGHQRIGLVVFEQQESFMDKTNLAALFVHQQELPAAHRIPPLILKNDAAKGLESWIRRYRPQAVLAGRDSVLDSLRELGHRVPHDFSFANFLLWNPTGKVAGILPGYERLGAAAVDLLVSELLHDHTDSLPNPRIVLVEGRWAEGATARKR